MSYWTDRNYSAVIKAVRNGQLQGQSKCEKCGQPSVVKHHEDYSKPLDVMYLCNRCHRLRHSVLGWGTKRRTPIGQCKKWILAPEKIHCRLKMMAKIRGQALEVFVTEELWRIIKTQEKE